MGLILGIVPATSNDIGITEEMIEQQAKQILELTTKTEEQGEELVALVHELDVLVAMVDDLEGLDTEEKSTLVRALNEVLSVAKEKAMIDDKVIRTTTTFSSKEIDNRLSEKTNIGHSHDIENVSGLTEKLALINDYLNQLKNTLDTKAVIDDTQVSLTTTWSSEHTKNELSWKAGLNHQHTLDEIENWQESIFSKEEVIAQINSVMLGCTWRPPVASEDLLPENPENGWACIVDDKLYIAIDGVWENFGDAFVSQPATPEMDGLLSASDKTKLDRLTHLLIDKLIELDLTKFNQLETQLSEQLELISSLLGKAQNLEEIIKGKADINHTHSLLEVSDWTLHLYNKDEVEVLIQAVEDVLETQEALIVALRSDLTGTKEDVKELHTIATNHQNHLTQLQTAIDRIDFDKLENLDLEAIELLKQEVETQRQKINRVIDSIEALPKIEDEQTSSDSLWSSSKITRELNQKANKTHTHTIQEVVELAEKLDELTMKDEALETDLAQTKADTTEALDRIQSFIEANNGVVTDLNALRQTLNTHTSQIGNLEALTTENKHSLVLAINELVAKTTQMLQINDNTNSSTAVWSAFKVHSELLNKSNVGHEHGLNSINDWRSLLYDKTQIDDLLNALVLGCTWKQPCDSLDDLDSLGTPEPGWATIVGGTSLYVYSADEGWINVGINSLPPVASQEYDGLMSKVDKTKLDSMDDVKLAQLDLSRFDTLSTLIQANNQDIQKLAGRIGINETQLIEVFQTLGLHQTQLDSIDFDKLEDILTNIDSETIHQLESDLSTLTSTITNVSQSVTGVEEDLNTQKQRLGLLETLPRIFYQTEEPNEAMNGSIWIVAD